MLEAGKYTRQFGLGVVRNQVHFDGPLLHSMSGPNTIMNPTICFYFFFLSCVYCSHPKKNCFQIKCIDNVQCMGFFVLLQREKGSHMQKC